MDDAPSPNETDAGPDRRRLFWGLLAGVLVAGVVTLLVVGLLNRDVGTSIQDALERGERPEAPAFTARVLQGGAGIGAPGTEVSLDDLRGRVVILNFWASWCEPCKQEAPVLEAVARTYRGRDDVLLLGMDVQDVTEEAQEFLDELGVTYPSLRDGTDELFRRYELTGVPETYVIDAEGRVALHIPGIVTDPAQITTPVGRL